MIELTIATVLVALAYAYRIGHDVGRGRNIVHVNLDGRALLIERRHWAMMQSLTVDRPYVMQPPRRNQGRAYVDDQVLAMRMVLDPLLKATTIVT